MVAKICKLLSQTLHLFAFVSTRCLLTYKTQSRVRTPQPPIPFFPLAACGDVLLCHSTQARTDRRDFGIFGK